MARFKKGSKEALAWGRRMKRLRNPTSKKKSKSPKIKRRYVTMPRKKKRKVSRSKTASIWGINTGKAASAGLYGAMRSRMSNYLRPYTARIPVGAVSDEVGMVVALQVLKKYVFKGKGIMRDAATAGQAIEFARIGEAFATGQVSLGALSAGTGNTGMKF